jgi:hypothetical protein
LGINIGQNFSKNIPFHRETGLNILNVAGWKFGNFRPIKSETKSPKVIVPE